MRFRSKIDAWLILLLGAALGAAVTASWGTLPAQGLRTALLIAVPVLLTVGLPVWMFFVTYYQVAAGQLKVVSGPFRWHIPLNEIEQVRDSKSLRSAPALSLYRLEITYSGGQTLLVSPFDREGFLGALGWSDGS